MVHVDEGVGADQEPKFEIKNRNEVDENKVVAIPIWISCFLPFCELDENINLSIKDFFNGGKDENFKQFEYENHAEGLDFRKCLDQFDFDTFF